MSNIDKRADSVSRIIADLKLKHGSGDTYAPIMRWDELLALLDELEAAERRNEELTDALKQTVSGYKSCLRTGHERILDLGGDCDAPEVMIAGNPDIQLAEKLIAAGTAKGE